MLTKCVFIQSLEGEFLARVNRDCYFDRTFHKTHVHTEPQKAYIQTKYMQKKNPNPTYLSQKLLQPIRNFFFKPCDGSR